MAAKSQKGRDSATPQASTSTSTASALAPAVAPIGPSNATAVDEVKSPKDEGGFLGEMGAFEEEVAVGDGGHASKAASSAAPVDPHSGLPTDVVANTAADGASGSGGALPYQQQIQASFGEYDIGGVKAHTDAESTAALGANAYTAGADVVLSGAASLSTVAEEATHAVVQGAGKGPSGVGQEGDSFERHADQVAKRVEKGESAVDLLDQMTGGDRSVTPGASKGVQREVAPAAAPAAATAETTAEPAGPEAPRTVELNTPGGKLVVNVPGNATPGGEVTVANPNSPISGVTFNSVRVAFDEQFNTTGGSATVDVDRGLVQGGGTLDIVGTNVVGDVDVKLESALGTGEGKAAMTESGIASSGTISANAVNLSNGLRASESSVTWNDNASGLAIDGSVGGSIADVGQFGIDLAYAEGTVGGEVAVDLAERTLLGQAKVKSGSLTGTYGDEGITVAGPMEFGVGDWASGSSDGTLDLTNKTLTGSAAAAVADVSRGELQLHSGSVEVGVNQNTFEGGAAAFDLSAKGFRGGLEDGVYDPAADRIDGTVNAALEGEAKDLGSVSLKSAAGQLKVEANTPTSLDNASAQIGVKVGEEADKINASIEALDYDLAIGSISGVAKGSTASPIEVAEGAVSVDFQEATADVQSNVLTEVAGSATVEAGKTENGRMLSIAGTGTVDTTTGSVKNASGAASLLQSPVNLAPGFDLVGASGTASVEADQLKAAGVDADWKSPNFEGKVNGAFDAEEVKVDGDVTASVHTPATLGPATVDSGSGTLTVAENAPKAFTGNAAGKLGTDFEFDAESIDVDVEKQEVGGSATIGIQEGKSVDVAAVGSIEQMNATGEVEANELQSVDGEVAGSFAPGSTPFLDFNLDGKYRATDSVVEQATGDLSLAEGETRELGPITLDAFAATASVTENAPSLDSATVGFHTDAFKGGIESANLDLDKKEVSGQATAELTAPKTIGALEITSASGTADVEKNQVGTLTGAIAGSMKAGENTVEFSADNVDYDLENDNVSGEVTASTSDFLNLIPNRLKAKVTEAKGEIKDNSLDKVSGDYDIRVANEGEESLKIGANGDFDVAQKNVIDATGEAELLKPFDLFNGALGVTEFIASGTVQNNDLKSGTVTAVADIKKGVGEGPESPKVQIDGSFEEDAGNFDFDGTASMEQFDVIKPNDQGRHLSASLGGTVKTKENKFDVSGGADYAINENFGGKLDAEMDQDFDPGITGSLDGKADLVKETTLFSFEKTLVYAPIPPIFGASLDAELSMSVAELSVEPEIGITEMWRPLSAATDLPDFDTHTAAKWGVSLEGALVPYLYGGIKSSIITAAVGGMGKAGLSADAGIDADVQLSGKNGEFGGEVGLGVDVGASLDLSAGVFAQLGVLGWDAVDWKKDDLVSYELADIFSMQWGKTFTFGDKGAGEKEGASVPKTSMTATEDSSAAAAPPTPETSRPRIDEKTTDDASVTGGPSITGESALESVSTDDKTAKGDEGEMGALELAMNALDAMKSLYDSVGGAVEKLADFPMGTFSLIWDIFQGKFKFDEILADARRVFDSMTDLMKFVAPMLEGWFMGFWEFIKNGPPNLLTALLGDSSAFRDVINDGTTLQNAPPEMLIHLLEGALWDDMWTSGADEAATLRLLRVAASRGVIDRILTVERTRDIFEELDHYSSSFRSIVVNNAPASVIRSELRRFVGHWRLDTTEERQAMSFIRAANSRGMINSVLSQDDAEDILGGMDGSRYDEMRNILRSNGYSV